MLLLFYQLVILMEGKLEGVLFLKAFMSIVHERVNEGANYCDKILRILQHLLNKI